MTGIFRWQTFVTLERNRRPFLSLNATDMSLGASFQFTQEHFDLSVLGHLNLPVARAVARQRAFPILLVPSRSTLCREWWVR